MWDSEALVSWWDCKMEQSMEDNSEISYKIKCRLMILSSKSIPWYSPEGMRTLHVDAHSSLMRNY